MDPPCTGDKRPDARARQVGEPNGQPNGEPNGAVEQVMVVDAAKGRWSDDRPPASGWQTVTLPDIWTKRWPGYDGVVWYRYRWTLDGPEGTPGVTGQADMPGAPLAAAPTRAMAVFIDYWNMAGALYLNGSLLGRDRSLAEPLTRAWNTPRLLLLPMTLLHRGTNELIVRVSGLSAYGPGLGTMQLGPLDLLESVFRRADFLRQDWQLISIAVGFAFGIFFFTLWALRREDRIYGWFCLVAFAWIVVGYNQIAPSPWPFRSSHHWQAFILLATVLYVWAYAMALLRFAERQLTTAERWLRQIIIVDAVGAFGILLIPTAWIEGWRIGVVLIAAAIFFASSLWFISFAVRHGRLKHRIVAFAALAFVVAAVHDLLTWLEVLSDNLYYSAITSQLEIVCIGFVLASDFVANIRRVERFNEELNAKIDEAREGLESTLKRQYELQLANARLNERLNLAHDLHDGLGGTLVSSIALLEQKGMMPAERFLPILKELRDDLRIIIDTAARAVQSEQVFYESLIPMRHRWTRLFEAQNIDCQWHLIDVRTCQLSTASTLEVMRVLQESLTNVLKHSGASRVDINLCVAHRQLILIVQDNGVGFPREASGRPEFGAGLQSIRKRVRRCLGTVRFDNKGGACVTVIVPCNVDDAVREA